jgi:hypothetical protein
MKTLHTAIPFGLAVVLGATLANAGDQTIRTPGDHPHYAIEVEPHGLFGFGGLGAWGGFGFGAGLRLSIPVMQNGFIPKINNSVAITFGGDFLHYENCYSTIYGLGYGCAANYLYFPVALQWNFFVAQKWSVMAELGAAPYYGFFDNYCDNLNQQQRLFCTSPSHFSVTPWFNAGGRYHFNEHVALTLRIGWPTFSVGVSFM